MAGPLYEGTEVRIMPPLVVLIQIFRISDGRSSTLWSVLRFLIYRRLRSSTPLLKRFLDQKPSRRRRSDALSELDVPQNIVCTSLEAERPLRERRVVNCDDM